MITNISDVPASSLRQRMIDDMNLRRFARKTQLDYVRHVARFATYLGRPPDTATAEDLRQFQIEQRDAGLGVPTSLVMLTTVVVVVATHDLAQGVLAGVLLSGIFFASKVSRMFEVVSELSPDGSTRTYRIKGEVFFASAEAFENGFDFREVVDRAVFDVHAAHFWDISAIVILDKVVLKFRREGTAVEVISMNEASATLVDRFAPHDKEGAALDAAAH